MVLGFVCVFSVVFVFFFVVIVIGIGLWFGIDVIEVFVVVCGELD